MAEIEPQMGVHERARPQLPLGIGKGGLEAGRAGFGVDLIVDEQQAPFVQLERVVLIPHLDLERASGAGPVDRRDLAGRQREHDGDGLKLRDHDQAVRIGGMHDIARIHLADSGPAAQGRADGGVIELNLGGVDRGPVSLHRGFELPRRRDRGIELLMRCVVLLR